MLSCSSDERALQKKGYFLGKKLGQGSYAKVRCCEYVADGKKELLACKIIDRNKAPDDFVTKFFPRELEIITWLDHPNVIRVHRLVGRFGSGMLSRYIASPCLFRLSILERQEKVFIFMQYAENGDLLDYIKNRGVIKENQARIWFRQLHGGLGYLHSKNVAHRDLKCENILLTKNWNVKLADFGFARSVLDPDGRRVLSETYCGSAAYAAPEVVRGSPYNPKMADVWSLGVILYIMVNAAMPFDDNNLKKMLKDQINKNWTFRSRVKDKLTLLLKDIIQRMLEPDVTRRLTIDRINKHDWIKPLMPEDSTQNRIPAEPEVDMGIRGEDTGPFAVEKKKSEMSCTSYDRDVRDNVRREGPDEV
ncbi:unnamed protein product [Cyprideis torosa]|uniref:Protein kinase domain-containing protein n=1 Tax=Cyprideis torosa TaxID=163714 RepID=A0A7R8ZNR2_9CRUS|nr:unnamed protein product [Cyprideis torosa]CAG0886904.1 unnamed protein product [Cyprideis torosa]